MISMDFTHVVSEPGALHCIDGIDPTTGLTQVLGETLEQVRLRYPAAIVEPWEEPGKRRRAASLSGPVETDDERWAYLLEVMPPVAWTARSGAETFKLSELTTDDITCCCIRIGRRYWTCQQPISTTHDALVQLVLDAFPGAR